MKSFRLQPAYLIKYFPVCISGFLFTLAFPSINFYPLAFVALVPFFVVIEKMNKKERFIAGLLAGLIHYLTLTNWLIDTLHIYGNLNIFIASSSLLLINIYLAFYFAFFSVIIGSFKYNSLLMPFLAASLWTALEYLRCYFFSGMPWCLTGYSQYLNNNFIQIADITGVYGVSFFVILINAFAALIIINIKREKKKVLLSGLNILLVFFAIFAYGKVRNNEIDMYMNQSQKMKTAVIQGNISQGVKWDSAHLDNTLNKYFALSEKASKENPDLIVWPETSLPFYYGFAKKPSEKVDAFVRKTRTNFLIGSPAFKRDKTKIVYYNRAYMLNRFSIVTGVYDKIHLVPFGEYIPLGKYLTFLGKLTAQAGEFSPGNGDTPPLEFGGDKAAVLICFEIIFPELSRNFVNKGADVLLTITNDAWFGHTSAAEQHFAMAVFRAIENRRSLGRAANTGISGFVDPKGQVIKKTAIFTEASLVQPLPLLKIKSFYTVFGDIFAIFCSIAIIICFVVNRVLILRLKKKL